MIGFGRFAHFNFTAVNNLNLTSSLKSEVSTVDASFLLSVLQDVKASPGVWLIALLVFVLVLVRVLGRLSFCLIKLINTGFPSCPSNLEYVLFRCLFCVWNVSWFLFLSFCKVSFRSYGFTFLGSSFDFPASYVF